MPVVRVYLPVVRDDLDQLATSGALDCGPAAQRSAFAVTEALARLAPGADVEDLEFAAFADAAAAASGVRGRADGSPAPRRAIAALDADPSWVSTAEGGPASRVSLTAPVPLARVASFHIDETEGLFRQSEDTVADAAADSGAGDMLWYDVTELDEVRSLLG